MSWMYFIRQFMNKISTIYWEIWLPWGLFYSIFLTFVNCMSCISIDNKTKVMLFYWETWLLHLYTITFHSLLHNRPFKSIYVGELGWIFNHFAINIHVWWSLCLIMNGESHLIVVSDYSCWFWSSYGTEWYSF